MQQPPPGTPPWHHDNTPPAYYAPPPPAPKRHRGWVKHLVGYAAVLLIGVSIGLNDTENPGSTTASITPAAETVTVEAAPEIITEKVTESITETVEVTATEMVEVTATETIEVTATQTVEVLVEAAPAAAEAAAAAPSPTPAAAAPAPAPAATTPAEQADSGDCAIKGNISSSGEKIYHVPGQRYYEATKIDLSKGERWFCSEQAALDAGWRKAKV